MTGGIQSGEIAFAIFNGVLVSLVVVWGFLALYRRAVEQTMRMTTPGEGAPLRFTPPPLDPRTLSPPPSEGLSAALVRRRLALASGIGFALSALALSWPEIDEVTRESSGMQSVVLMDLRGFTKSNAGCVFELQQLAAAGRLDSCVFVTDDTSDRALAASALGAQTNNPPRWVPVRKLEAEAMKALWDRLMDAARR